MKTKLPLIAAIYCGLSTVGSAFTLDFSGVAVNTGLPLTLNVPGYGSVSFSTINGTLAVETFAPGTTRAIAFDRGESILMTFNGNAPINLSNQYAGVNPGETFDFNITADPKVFSLALTGNMGGKAGLQSVSFDQVPEPSAALLGALGGIMLVVRRRR